MRMNKKPNDKIAVALVLCFCVLAIASIFTMRSGLNDIKPDTNSDLNIAKQDKDQQPDTKVVKPVPTVDSQNNKKNAEKSDEGGKTEAAAIHYSMPVKGEVSIDYSETEPIYSSTLEQYVVHQGMDFAAAAGTDVSAIADGTVTKVYTDDKLGLSIEILHPEGITSKYCNLNSTKKIGVGDVVKGEDVISAVGNSALFESADEPHLHFEVWRDGKAINPKEYLNRN